MLTRRDFVAELAGAAIVAALPMPAKFFASAPTSGRPTVVSIHLDQPYIDATGRALPYLPPDGVRSGAPVAHLSEAEFRRRFVYL
jgi:hypothetical protein